MEQMYQIAWVLLITSVTLSAITYFIAPAYICPTGNCPKEFSQAGTFVSQFDINSTKNILGTSQSGAMSGTTSSTPPGFWNFIGGTVTELVTGQSSGGLISSVLVPLVTFVAPVQVLSLYYANVLNIPILKNIVLVFVAIFSVIQIIGITFLIIYIAGLIRGVKA